MSKLHVKILQDAIDIIERGEVRHTCNAIKIVVNWHGHSPDPEQIKAAQDIIDHITQEIAPEHTFENWVYYKELITRDQWHQTLGRSPTRPSKVKRLRLEWMHDLTKYFEKDLDGSNDIHV